MVCVCVCVSVFEMERVYMCVYVCLKERERVRECVCVCVKRQALVCFRTFTAWEKGGTQRVGGGGWVCHSDPKIWASKLPLTALAEATVI